MIFRQRCSGTSPACASSPTKRHYRLPPASFDLVISLLNLHWVNDLPGALLQVRQALKPDGLFLAAMFGGETLKELRRAIADAEIENEGGLSPRISPFADVRDAGNLLQRAGFTLCVADVETLTVAYADPLALLVDLRGMGETNAVFSAARRPAGAPRCFARSSVMGNCIAAPMITSLLPSRSFI